MGTTAKLGAFAVGLAVVFVGAMGVGKVSGIEPATETMPAEHGDAGGETGDAGADAGSGGGHGAAKEGPAAPAVEVPGGLQIAQDGFALVPENPVVRAGVPTDLRFTVRGPDGRPVTEYEVEHEKRLHLIVTRRDLTGYQHLHPAYVGKGVWSVRLTLPAAGTYRAFADFRAEGAEAVTLGMDLTVPGELAPAATPKPARTAEVDGYTVNLRGQLTAGRSTRVTLSVSKDGRPVTDLQPYLGAYGHLVALRAGDLAYLHVHPEGEPGDGTTKPGPDIAYQVEVPSAGGYRLFLDFQHGGVVRTAEFTVSATRAGAETPAEGESDGHGHEGGGH